MRHPRYMAHLVPLTLLLLSAMPAVAAHAPSAGDMSRCAAVAAPDARLACYDNLARQLGVQLPAAAAAIPAATPAGTATTTAVAAAPATVAAAPSPADAERDFGFTQDHLHPVPKGPPAVHAHVASIAENRIGGAQVVLDNGQTWIFTDNDGRVSSGDAVTIKRGSLGSFIMTSASNHTYHVHRVQ